MSFWDVVGNVVIPGVVNTVGSLIGSRATSRAAEQAATANQQAHADSARLNWDMYQQNRADMAPSREIGENALFQLASLFGLEYEGAPGTMEDRFATAMNRFATARGYDFRVGEGVRALDRSAAARGRLVSGAHDRALAQLGQNLASAEYGDYVNRLAALAGMGQSANTSLATAGAAAAGRSADAILAGGAARASGYTGSAAAFNRGIENALLAWRPR